MFRSDLDSASPGGGRIPCRQPAALPWAKFSRGQATLEMLVVLMILIPLIFGAFELSRGIAVRAALDSGVGVGVRALSLDPTQLSWVRDVVESTLDQNVFGTSGVTFNSSTDVYTTLSCSSSTPQSIEGSSFGTTFCLIGEADFKPEIPFITNTQINIRVCHCGLIERVSLP